MEINIAYSSDEYYSKNLFISILSLFENNYKNNMINIYLFSNNISNTTIDKIKKMVNQYNHKIYIIDFDEIKNRIKTDYKFPLSAFARLFLDEFVPKDRVLYLDCDSVISGDLSEIYNIDLGENICAAVQDIVMDYYKTSIGLEKNDIYFNSGMILFDLKKWKANNMQDKAIKLIAQFNGSVPHHDQGVFNAICKSNVLRVHPKFNFQCSMFEFKIKELLMMEPNYYCENEIKEAIKHPIFIHYTEGFSNRPWRENCTHPQKEIYLRYMYRCFPMYKLENKKINCKSIILKYIYKILPFIFYFNAVKYLNYVKSRGGTKQ